MATGQSKSLGTGVVRTASSPDKQSKHKHQFTRHLVRPLSLPFLIHRTRNLTAELALLQPGDASVALISKVNSTSITSTCHLVVMLAQIMTYVYEREPWRVCKNFKNETKPNTIIFKTSPDLTIFQWLISS